MSRLAETFANLRRDNRTGLIAYVTMGFPDVPATHAIVTALVEGGADVIELGVPFSDPLADGATIQRSTYHALQQGVTLATCLQVTAGLRRAGVVAPIVFMGYYNPLLAYGLGAFFPDAAAAGVDGLIVVDSPIDEADGLREEASKAGIDLIQMIAPTTSEDRIAALLSNASGFVYCVSIAGTTGARGALPETLPDFIARVRRHTKLPIAVGFGVSRFEHVASIGRLCEAAAIGSAIVDVIERAQPGEYAAKVREYVEEVTGRRRAHD
ncbi:MAG: tryptophan synthase subunit alpha [Dehalococcoidia bacterium]